MKPFDKNYVLLEEMYADTYFPNFLVDKIKQLILEVVSILENGEQDKEIIQDHLDQMTLAINDLEDEFDENDSEIETVARDSIAVTVEYILNYYEIDIDIEEALREREW